MGKFNRWSKYGLMLASACSLAACGGGSGNADPASTPAPVMQAPAPQEPGSPASANNVATDGLNWVNFRRTQIGMPVLVQNGQIDQAASGHSEYQRINNIVSHDQTAGKPGFTGLQLADRLSAAGYTFGNASFAYGEVISATNSDSGAYMVDSLVTAIYHRFVIFEPMFKEIGTGAARRNDGYTYFTANFAARGGLGAGIATGAVVVWPFNGQTNVTRNFFSDEEAPDPVANANEVGYPVSVHANISANLGVQQFRMRERGAGADVSVKLLSKASDAAYTPASAAALVPLAPLKANTTYDVSFSGTIGPTPVARDWSFTTK
ncbi:MAG: CAP domain-containing protein [Pseudomonadota bacterium]